MRAFSATLLLLAVTVYAQDVVDVECGQESIKVKIQKEVVVSAGYDMGDVHLNDNSCSFDLDDGNYFMKVIDPLTACNTIFTVNDTHVEFSNTITTLQTGATYPLGIVVGPQKSDQSLSAFISCTYRIDLRVSTLFFPNITIIPIIIPAFAGLGEFKVAMSLYTDATYRIPYATPPILSAEETLYVGVNIVDEASPLTYLLVERCWGTVYEDPDSTPSYPLIEDGCPIKEQGDKKIFISQNGLSHQAMWNGPVFQFIGKDVSYDTVWLHCDLQICINRSCEPICEARRRRRSANDELSYYGPDNFDGTTNIISIGPLKKITKPQNKTMQMLIIENASPRVVYPEHLKEGLIAKDNTLTIAVVVGVLGALALVSIILALFLLLVKIRNRPSNTGYDLSGNTNKAFAT